VILGWAPLKLKVESHKAHIVTLQFKVDNYHNSVSGSDAKT